MAEPREVDSNLINPEVSYERQDVGVSGLAIGAVLIVLFGLIGVGLSFFILNTMETRRSEIIPTPLPLIQLRPTPLPPRLQPNPLDQRTAEEDIATLRSHEEELLNNYGWVDREAGIVRIPIDQAIELLAEDGAAQPGQ
jgi:hypothetical protein